MTVDEVIAELQEFPGDAQVIVEVRGDWRMRTVEHVCDESHWIYADGNAYITAEADDTEVTS